MAARLTTEEFIRKAKLVHTDENGYCKYEYHKVNYQTSKEKITVVCTLNGHGSFDISPSSHLKGSGCKICAKKLIAAGGRKRRLSTETFIDKAKAIFGNDIDFSDAEYTRHDKKINLSCNKCNHRFSVKPSMFLWQKTGCPNCSRKEAGVLRRKSVDDFIKEAREIHGQNRYDYRNVEMNGTDQKVSITCHLKGHGEFKQTPANHIHRMAGCPKCSILIRSEKTKIGKTEYLNRFEEKYGSGVFDYSEFEYITSHTPSRIRCVKHDHWFNQTPYVHLTSAYGCDICAKESVSEKKRIDINEIKKRFKDTHGEDFDYSLVNFETINSVRDNIEIICEKGHVFKQSVINHYRGNGCRLCHFEKIGDYTRIGRKQYIDKAKEIWGDFILYDKFEYNTITDKGVFFCVKHNEYFEQNARSHLAGNNGCKKCAAENVSRFFNLHTMSSDELNRHCIYYHIEMKHGNDVFQKVGITTKGIESRYSACSRHGISYNIIDFIESTYENCVYLEEDVLNKMKEIDIAYRVHTLKKFQDIGGWSECFRSNQEIENYIKESMLKYK